MITPDTPLLSAPRATIEQCVLYIAKHPTGEYTHEKDVPSIVSSYFRNCAGLDPRLLLAQVIHETGNLSSWWAARPRRNPAGIGVTGRKSALEDKPSGAWQDNGTFWLEGLAFASWDLASKAHVGRLLAYALPAGSGTPEQRQLIADALKLRSLPARYRGCAPTLRGLGGTWAVPGTTYASKIADIANAILT